MSGTESQPQRLDPADPYLREAQTFPVLAPEMAARVAAFGDAESFDEGAELFRRGERNVDFFLCVTGSVEIIDSEADGQEHIVHVHAAGQFTGELDLFNDRTILVTGRARANTQVVRVSRVAFRRMIAAEPDIGEI
ncbi:MAG: cyclic nucleotide-binding domain-containing protein, partial [Pseudomonadota bacterium]